MSILVRENIPLAPLISFKVGGPARYFVEPSTPEEFSEALGWARQKGLETFILGKGTNLVFSDQGFPGLVLYTGKSFHGIAWEGNRVRAQAGALLHTVVTQSVGNGMAGIQHLAGIPGTMGGGTYINAGAFGQELKEVIVFVTSTTMDGKLVQRTNEECGFAYRHSHFFHLNEIILETALELVPGDPDALRAEMRETLRKRKEKQPLNLPNAGSMFKRPPGQYAGVLIERTGLKGFRMGGAMISEKHSNFTVNAGGATAQDIHDLSSEVIRRVKEATGTTLEREVIFIGEFLPWPR
ncbi:MAG: UDP-N-acetylmuramate dehydrogenase --_ transferred, now [Fibrobacteres bacterium]|nr:UDP-N-acetylmuramate dehydrogenase --> transferred, now [Fibrobacterota bacterium]